MSKRHVCTCQKCGKEMELGDLFYKYDDVMMCERCFEDFLEKITKESEGNVQREDCDDYDPNKGCFSYDW